MAYQPSFDGYQKKNGQASLDRIAEDHASISYDEIKGQFAARLIELQAEEIRRGVTTIGPHRDEIRFFSNEMDLGVYGSRGQIRTAVMALKISETQWLQAKTGELPVLLLDETLAELDESRRGDLLGSLGLEEQAILTTTDLGLFSEDFTKNCQIWSISAGVIEKKAD